MNHMILLFFIHKMDHKTHHHLLARYAQKQMAKNRLRKHSEILTQCPVQAVINDSCYLNINWSSKK